jgi:hypothetical protein
VSVYGRNPERVLVVGIPRGGTTWVGEILGQTAGTAFLNEPDNHFAYPFAFRAKRRLRGGFYPYLQPDDTADLYDRLWGCALPASSGVDGAYRVVERRRRAVAVRLLRSASQRQMWDAFAGRRPAGRLALAERLAVPERPVGPETHLVVKSVYAALAVEWIASRHPVKVVVVERSPLNVVASWKEMGWLGRPGDDMLDTLGRDVQAELARRWRVPIPPPGSSVVARAAWLVAVLTVELRSASTRNPSWVGITHEDLVEAPHDRFRTLADSCGLAWSSGIDVLLDSMNAPGRGYELLRVRAELRDAWRSRLDGTEVAAARAVLEAFGVER